MPSGSRPRRFDPIYLPRSAARTRLTELFNFQISFGWNLALLTRIEPVELRFHELHPFLLGDLSILVSVHQSEQLFRLLLAIRNRISLFWNGCLLCEGGTCKCISNARARNEKSCNHETFRLILNLPLEVEQQTELPCAVCAAFNTPNVAALLMFVAGGAELV